MKYFMQKTTELNIYDNFHRAVTLAVGITIDW